MKLREASFVVLKTNVNKLLGKSHLHVKIHPTAWHNYRVFKDTPRNVTHSTLIPRAEKWGWELRSWLRRLNYFPRKHES